MSSGRDLIEALKNNLNVRSVDNCPGASVAIGKAMYGRVQNDENGTKLERSASRQDIANLLYFHGLTTQTAVWHFSVDPVHHFVVIPWYQHSPPHWMYTVLMAYENQYTIGEYIRSAPGRMSRGLAKGYQDEVSSSELVDMLWGLLQGGSAWNDYFLAGTQSHTRTLTCYKYKPIALDDAVANVARG